MNLYFQLLHLMSSEITLDTQNTKYIYWTTSDRVDLLQNLLKYYKIYWTTSEFTEVLQILLMYFWIYWTTSEFAELLQNSTEPFQIFTELLGGLEVQILVLLDLAEVYYHE